jgi:hypothetical protein
MKRGKISFLFARFARKKGRDVVHFSALPKNEPQILVNMQAKRATVGNSRFVRTHYLKVGFYPVSCITINYSLFTFHFSLLTLQRHCCFLPFLHFSHQFFFQTIVFIQGFLTVGAVVKIRFCHFFFQFGCLFFKVSDAFFSIL